MTLILVDRSSVRFFQICEFFSQSCFHFKPLSVWNPPIFWFHSHRWSPGSQAPGVHHPLITAPAMLTLGAPAPFLLWAHLGAFAWENPKAYAMRAPPWGSSSPWWSCQLRGVLEALPSYLCNRNRVHTSPKTLTFIPTARKWWVDMLAPWHEGKNPGSANTLILNATHSHFK